MEASHKKHEPHIKVGKDAEEEVLSKEHNCCYCCMRRRCSKKER